MSDTSQGCVLCTSDRDQEEILWRNDRCFPDPIWAPARRHPALARPAADSEALRRALILHLGPPEDDAP